jgi:hypothetical protein
MMPARELGAAALTMLCESLREQAQAARSRERACKEAPYVKGGPFHKVAQCLAEVHARAAEGYERALKAAEAELRAAGS